jgi:hypothetical protein
MQPRIYTYKITFEEIPHWYWGVHREKRYNDGYMGSPVTHKWMWEFYTPRIQILEVFPYTDGGWDQAVEIERRLILPDLNSSLCLNERCGKFPSLESCRKAGRNGLSTIIKNNPSHQSQAAKKAGQVALEEGRLEWMRKRRDPEKLREHARRMGANQPLEVKRANGMKTGAANLKKTIEKNPNHQREIALQKWMDPDHPELGSHNSGVLVRKQKALGYPHSKENRVRVE